MKAFVQALTPRILLPVILILTGLSFAQDRAAASPDAPLCTPIPALYDDWKTKAFGANATEDEVERHLEKFKAKAERLSKTEPFTRLACDMAARERYKERVLWEDERAFVLVDKFHDRNSSTPKPLVIPKEKMVFPTKTSEDLLDHLARVAAATSDALMRAAGQKQCNLGAASHISISTPAGIGVGQLHIHVNPKGALPGLGNTDQVYTEISESLSKLLGQSRGC